LTNNSTQDRYIQPEDRVYVQPEVELTLYSPENRGGIKINPTTPLVQRPLKVMVHGFLTTGEGKGREMATAFLTPRTGQNGNVNVIVVRWNSKYLPYINAAFRAINVGEFLARWLLQTVYPKNPNLDLHLIGHSLGAQAVGQTGRLLGNSGRLPMRVTGLDPAGPNFEWFQTKGLETISKSSGQFVDIIHTNPGVLGVKKQYGHLDFYVDGGYQNLRQFKGTNIKEKMKRCKQSHSFATKMFIETILDPWKYPSIKCANVDANVDTYASPICTHRRRSDGLIQTNENYLGIAARKKPTDEAYGTYIPFDGHIYPTIDGDIVRMK